MRPYRGWTKDGKWVKGWYVLLNSTHYIIKDGANARSDYMIVWIYSKASTWIEVLPETVGESTGLKDKNGVEIFEGDISQTVCPNGTRLSKFLYFWDDENTSIRKKRLDDGAIFDCDKVSEELKEVIGNVTDNSELLEAE